MNFNELFQKGTEHLENGEYDQALSSFRKAVKAITQKDSKEDIVQCHLNLYRIYYRKTLYAKCNEHIEAASALSSKINNEILHAKVLNNKGVLYKNLAKYQQALRCLLDAASIFEKHREAQFLSNSYSTIGMIYRHLRDLKRAIEYHLKALKIRKTLGLKFQVAKSKNNLANIYLQKNDLVKAEKYIRGAIKRKKSLNMEEQDVKLANSYSILASILKELGNSEKAMSFYQKSLKRRLKYKDIKGLVGSYLDMGIFYREYGDFTKSVEMLKKSLKLSKQRNLPSCVAACLLELFITYKKQKKYKQALKYHIKYQDAYQKLFTDKLWEFIKEKQIEFEVLQKDKTIENMKINIREFHHRIKNNFQSITSLLSSHYNTVKDDKLKNLIRETEARIQAMMSVHRYLFNKIDSSHINMREYMENLIENLMLSYGYSDEDIELLMEISDKELPSQKAMHFGLIVNELISNSFKYAFWEHKNPKLQVVLDLQKNERIYLLVSDNGSGFNPKKKREDAFGLKLIETLSEQLKGNGEFTFTNGTQFELNA